MSKTLKINIPEGFKIDSFNQETGDISFAPIPKDIMEQIQSFEDVCALTGKNPEDYVCNSDDQDDIAANALKMALLISRAYNESCNKKLDWDNDNQPKYCHCYYKSSAGWSLSFVDIWRSNAICGSRLYFVESKHAQDAWNKFSHIYINLIK
ncbi:hypothetical protein [Flavobacterium suncheonense]|uniref:Uncharacterized protein n=1 Tax=Flavobacterium suncheonense GH29-5 = DSM 17707 TaxID=1121899 RepID=A0A0A2MDT8_9FLAO|nr:hypothetical protein [Flavobacterium suncheonense]KGO89756.1 hypothetical protein Q764_06090 [Flavobacterium suncheonense GH29-5 = DSM 17707]